MNGHHFDDLKVGDCFDNGGIKRLETQSRALTATGMTKLPIMLVAMLGVMFIPVLCGQAPLPCPSSTPAAKVSAVMAEALCERDLLPGAVGSLWRFEGPRNIKGGSHDVGLEPYSGRMNELAIDPINPSTMYATGALGGVWKTSDGGKIWAARSAGWPVQSATAVAIDPNHANRVFAGTGDYKRADHTEPFSVGVMRSVDGGLTWQRFGTDQMRDFTISRIVIDPQDSNHVLATAGRGSRLPGGNVFRSTDAGATWMSVGLPDANWDDLELCDQHIFWAAATRKTDLTSDTDGQSGLLFRSIDGLHWTKVNIVTPNFNLDTALPLKIHIAGGPTRLGDVVFVAVAETDNNARVFGTKDHGNQWTEVGSVETGGGAWARGAFAVTTNFLYFGGTNLHVAPLSSLIAGSAILLGTVTFDGVIVGNPPSIFPVVFTSPIGGVPADVQCVIPDPTESDAVFICDDKGVYRFSPQLNRLTSLNATLGVTQVWRMDVHPRHGGLIAIAEQDFGDSVSFFGLGGNAAAIREQNWAVVIGGDGGSAAFKGDSSSHVYLSRFQGGEVARYDGTEIARTPNPQADLFRPPVDDDDTCSPPTCGVSSQTALLYRGDLDVLGVTERTQFFSFTHPDTVGVVPSAPSLFPSTPGGRGILTLAACPTDPNLIYAAGEFGELFRSTNGGNNWPAPALDRTGLPAGAPIWTVSPSATSCSDVLAGVGYERTLNRGSNTFSNGDRLFHKANVTIAGAWTGAHGGPQALPRAPVFDITRHPSAPDSDWFVSTDVGVFRTDNGGVAWTNATAPLGLPNVPVRDLRLSADGNTLYAGTFGRGVWSMDVHPPVNAFGVRGLATQASRPISGARVSASGPGRIKQWLKNTVTAGGIVTTAPIQVKPSATISAAAVSLLVSGAEAASLVTPFGAFPLTANFTVVGNVPDFRLTSASAAALVGHGTAGEWAFSITGKTIVFNGVTARLIPSVKSGSVDFQFDGSVSTTTGSDGEYTIEYLNQGSHFLSTSINGVPQLFVINLDAHRTNVNFAVAPVGVAALDPKRVRVRVHEPLTYKLAYQITNGRNWHELAAVQLIVRDEERTILWIEFDPAQGTFSLVDQNGTRGPAFAPGSPNRLETSAATVYLADSRVDPSASDTSSVMLTIKISFKPRADSRIYDVEVVAVDRAGGSQGPYPVGSLQVGDIASATLPVPPVEE